MKNLTIDEELKNLIPPLTDEEFKQLEANILRDGIQDPLKVWNGILIDGHNRYNIAQKHNLDFNVIEMDFPDKDAVKQWIIQNQFGRRNISTFNRICLALKLKPIIAAESKKRMEKGTADPKPILAQGTTNEQIAKLAGVGKESVRKVEKILELSNQVNLSNIIAGLEKGDISISLAYEAAIIRKEKLDTLTSEAKNHLKEAIEEFRQAELHYKEFCKRYEAASPSEREKHAADKKELDAAHKFFSELLSGTLTQPQATID